MDSSKSPGSSLGAVIPLAVGLTWAFHSVLEFAQSNNAEPANVPDWVGVVSFSVALAVLAAAAWLIAELSGRTKSVVAAAAIMATGGLVAAVANFVEDGFRVEAFGKIFAYGLGGVFVGLLGLAVSLALGRRVLLAALSAATFAGVLMSNEAGGGLLILAAWLVAAVGLLRTGSAKAEADLNVG